MLSAVRARSVGLGTRAAAARRLAVFRGPPAPAPAPAAAGGAAAAAPFATAAAPSASVSRAPRSAGVSPERNARLFSDAPAAQEAALPDRDVMEYDVVVVGAGPAGLASAIKLKQLDPSVNVCVVEKGAEVGAHILSGNVFNPRGLEELFPDWKERGAPLKTKVGRERVVYLPNDKLAIPTPIPPPLHNEGNYIISLAQLVRWMGAQAEQLGVDVFPGFAGSELLYDDAGAVAGIATGDMGLNKDGTPGPAFQRGMELRCRQLVLSEGCRGSLSEKAMDNFNLRAASDVQTYGLGLKEVWEVDSDKHEPGLVVHTFGYPADSKTYAGSFMYHMEPNLVLVGFVVGLDYANPYLNPYKEFQRLKHHPEFAQYLEGGRCVSYGARCINEGGIQSLPKLTFPGGLLAGCSAGFLNVPAIKGSHMAIKSGVEAAEAIHETLQGLAAASHASADTSADAAAGSVGEPAPQQQAAIVEPATYESRMRSSWVWDELHQVRNFHGVFSKFGLYAGLIFGALDSFLLKGRYPWTYHNATPDAAKTRPAAECSPIEYPKPDGKLSFDILTSVSRTGTFHEESEPCHLRVKEDKRHMADKLSWERYAGPESRFCPAQVYEYVDDPQQQGAKKLVINSQNCIHCKCCSIKTPEEFIEWTVPQGGGGPKYDNM